MNRPAIFTQADIARLAKGARQAGLTVTSIEVDRNGRLVARFGDASGGATEAANEWDEVLSHGQEERPAAERH